MAHDLVIIFRTPSEIEANVIRGLLETHGIRSALLSDNSRTAFPLVLNDQSWERRVAVSAEHAEAAQRIIESHRDDMPGGRVVPFGSELEPLEQRIQTPRTEAVAVPRKFLDHAQTEDRPVSSVMKNVQPDQPRIQITVRRGRVLLPAGPGRRTLRLLGGGAQPRPAQ